MVTTYQIRNVLRIYGNQLKKRTMLLQESADPPMQSPDIIRISDEARRKQMLDKISNKMAFQITRNDYLPGEQGDVSLDNNVLNLEVERKNYEN